MVSSLKNFPAFHECSSGVTGEAIAHNILCKLTEWQLHIQFFRGQHMMGLGQWLVKIDVLLLVSLQSIPRQCRYIVHHTGSTSVDEM